MLTVSISFISLAYLNDQRVNLEDEYQIKNALKGLDKRAHRMDKLAHVSMRLIEFESKEIEKTVSIK